MTAAAEEVVGRGYATRRSEELRLRHYSNKHGVLATVSKQFRVRAIQLIQMRS